MAPKIKKSVWAIYPTRLALEDAIDRLRENGFLSSDIPILLSELEARRSRQEIRKTSYVNAPDPFIPK
jgi:hypothetical protein